MDAHVEASEVAGTEQSSGSEKALAVYREARMHKRLANQHKRRARTLMEQFSRFKRDLEAMGIEVIVEPSPNDHLSPQGGTSDNSSGIARD